MEKRKSTKIISIILAILLIFQLIPASLLGFIATPALATNGSGMGLPEGHTYDIPSESYPWTTAQAPDTFIIPDAPTTYIEPDGMYITESEIDLPALTGAEIAEAKQYAGIVFSDKNISELTSDELSFVCEHVNTSDSELSDLELQDVSLQDSIRYISLANQFDFPVSDILAIAPSEEAYQELSVQISFYKAIINDDVIGTELDTELRGYMMQGFSVNELLYAYGFCQVFELELDALLSGYADEEAYNELISSERIICEEYAGRMGISPETFAACVLENDLSIAEAYDARFSVEEHSCALTSSISPQSSGSSGDEGETAEDPYLGAPYVYSYDNNESVSLNSGELTIQAVDYTLPGVNGLDLQIGRRYSSGDANVYLPKGQWNEYTVYEYYVIYAVKAFLHVPGFGSWSEPLYDTRPVTYGPFDTIGDAVVFAATLPLAPYDVPSSDPDDNSFMRYTPSVNYQKEMADYHSYSYSYTGWNTYLNDSFGLGQGWSFAFSSIQGGRYLHLSTGVSYEIKFNGDNASNLKDYTLGDLCLEKDWNAFSNGSVSSQYTLTYKDGKQEFFSNDGKLIGIKDRYDNTITFVNTMQNGYPHTVITDTLGRVTTISGQNTEDDGHTMTVSLPDSSVLTYNIEHMNTTVNNSTVISNALASYSDAAGSTTSYSYTVQEGGFDVFRKSTYAAKNYFLNLTTITHPTRAQSVYSYEAVERNINVNGLAQEYRVVSRSDLVGRTESNIINFSYSADDYSGYPSHRAPDSLPDDFTYTITAEDTNRTKTIHTFNNDNLQVEQRTVAEGKTYQEMLFEYNADTLPTKQTVRSFSPANQSVYLETITAAEYDNKGNLTAEWSPLANGDTTNTAYKISYTYDSTYNLPLTKSYNADEDTRVVLKNTLDAECKNITRVQTFENDEEKSRTDFAFDTYGNTTSQKNYLDGFADYQITEYSYSNNAYLSKEKHTGILDADGAPAASTPGEAAGVIALSYSYDDMGRMVSSADGEGNITGFAYDAIGNVACITNPDGTTVRYDRNYRANTVTVTDENRAAIKHTYTPLGLEHQTIDMARGIVISYKEYNQLNQLESVNEYVNGSLTEYVYDALGRVTSETAFQGTKALSELSYSYDDAAENGTYSKVTKTIAGDVNAPSIVTTQYTDKCGNVVKTGRPLDGKEYFGTNTYDYVGNLLTSTSAYTASRGKGVTGENEYNYAGQVVKSSNADGDYLSSTYNALGQLASASDFSGTQTSYAYDALGRLISETYTIEQGQTATKKSYYDANGNITRTLTPVNAVGSASAWSETEYEYDSRAKLVCVAQYDDGAVQSVTRYTYDGVGNTLSMTTGLESLTDSGGALTTYTYDRFGNVLTMTDAVGHKEEYTYTALGRLITKTDRNGVKTTYVYDALGRVLASGVDAQPGVELIAYTYAMTGAVRSENNGVLQTLYYYDELGRVTGTEEVEPDDIAYTVTLDANGGKVSTSIIKLTAIDTYNLPTPTRTGYAFLGWYLGNTRIKNGDPVNIEKNCTFVARWTANRYTIVYRGNGGLANADPVKETVGGIYPPTDTYTQTCFYDQEITLRVNEFDRYDYRFLGWSTSSSKVGYRDVKYFDRQKNLKNLTAVPGGIVNLWAVWTKEPEFILPVEPSPPLVAMSIGIDAEDIIEEAENTAKVAEKTVEESAFSTRFYTYDLMDNRTSFTLNLGSETVQSATYTYDGLGRLATVSEDGTSAASYAYDTNGNLASLTYANGVTESYSYNLANWVTSVKNQKGTSTLSSFNYTYYADGNQKTKSDNAGALTSYTYDDLGRLTSESETGGDTIAYTYDANSNRASMTVTGKKSYTTVYEYDAANKLLSETKDSGLTAEMTNYSYDANGNMLSAVVMNATGGIASSGEYTYNGFNQLIVHTDTDNVKTTYAYDSSGLRVSKNGTGYIWDAGSIVAEVENGEAAATYLRGMNLIRSDVGGAESYYLYNAHGDVVQLTDSRGAVTKSYDYDAFGNETDPDSADANPFRYCGEYYDVETETYYLRARNYDPSTGRFTQQDTHWNTSNMVYGDNPVKRNEREADPNDPLGLSTYTYVPDVYAIMQSGNLYAYAVNNPVMFADANGESITLACIFVFAVVGAIIGGVTAAKISKSQLGYVDGWWVLGGTAAGGLVGGLVGWGVGAAATAIGATLTAGSGGVLGTTVYQTWQSAEQALRNGLNAVSQTFQTTAQLGSRVVDAFSSKTGIIAEAKYGYVSLTQFVQQQIAKDIWLLQNNAAVKAVEWHFYQSVATGKGGPSGPLLEALIDAGFKIFFH